MSKLSRKFFELQEQADFYGMELDVETLEISPKKPEPKRTWLDNYKDKVSEGDDGPESAFEAWA